MPPMNCARSRSSSASTRTTVSEPKPSPPASLKAPRPANLKTVTWPRTAAATGRAGARSSTRTSHCTDAALPHAPPPEDAAQSVGRLRSNPPMGQTCSAGLACWDFAESIDDLLGRADKARYLAKAGGRNQLAEATLSE